MSTHHCVMTAEAPGLDRCIDCGRPERNPATADEGVRLGECPCGRGFARFMDKADDDPVCGACYSERYARGEAVA